MPKTTKPNSVQTFLNGLKVKKEDTDYRHPDIWQTTLDSYKYAYKPSIASKNYESVVCNPFEPGGIIRFKINAILQRVESLKGKWDTLSQSQKNAHLRFIELTYEDLKKAIDDYLSFCQIPF